ncbi:MAG: GAF domain-containing protein [Betaproteobacteria bacterium]|nr:GAF domain-containing protein [Betaproteobacteria bacterium]
MQIELDQSDKVFTMLEQAGQAALDAPDAVSAMRILMRGCFETLGDRQAHLTPGALLPGERQYFVAGTFFVTPDRRYHMLCGNVGFPPEQERLCIPIDGGHPGQVYASRSKKILKNTDEHGSFRQYLKSSRMGSTVFAPLLWQGEFIGQLIVAAQARHTMRDADLQALVCVARIATAAWIAHGGPAWLETNYPPENGFYVDREGVRD